MSNYSSFFHLGAFACDFPSAWAALLPCSSAWSMPWAKSLHLRGNFPHLFGLLDAFILHSQLVSLEALNAWHWSDCFDGLSEPTCICLMVNDCLSSESSSFKAEGGPVLGDSMEASTGCFPLSMMTSVDNRSLILGRLWRSSEVVKAWTWWVVILWKFRRHTILLVSKGDKYAL